MSLHSKSPERTIRSSVLIVIYTLLVPYFEIVFNLSTVKQLFTWGTPLMLLFAVPFGLIGYLLVSLFRNPKAHYIASIVWMVLLAVPYMVQYFVYRGFQLFYDINTMVYGAEDMVDGYSDIALGLIFSWDGIFKIILFLLPAVLYAVIGRELYAYKQPIPVNALFRGLAAAVTVLCYCLAALSTYSKDVAAAVYTTEYNYQSAVQHFGLLTGMRLDLQKMWGGGDKGDFEDIPALEVIQPEVPTPPLEDSEEPVKPIVYEENRLGASHYFAGIILGCMSLVAKRQTTGRTGQYRWNIRNAGNNQHHANRRG